MNPRAIHITQDPATGKFRIILLRIVDRCIYDPVQEHEVSDLSQFTTALENWLLKGTLT